jgi:signal transduction histidine kinase
MMHISIPDDPIHEPDGTEQNTVVRVVDVAAADRSTAERCARATQQLGALGEMTMGIVHDFRNVLAAVESSLRLAERHSRESEKVHIFIAGAREGVSHAVKLTSRLLTFVKDHEMDLQQGDANACLANLELLLKYSAGPGVRVVLELTLDIPRCLIDPSQFNAAILNLVVNARDAMPNGGDVKVSTARWTEETTVSDSLAPGAYVLVRVKDNGEGMSPDVAQRVFDPFFTTKGERGTGLGLPQVCAFMQRIGGQVRVASERGVGTTVDLLLPVAGSDAIILPPTRGLTCDTRASSCEVSTGGMIADQLPGVAATNGRSADACNRDASE